MQEGIGTGGGGFRFMHAAFLQEAGDRWRRFALACARVCKGKTADFDPAEIARLLRECAAQEKSVYAFEIGELTKDFTIRRQENGILE